jgi:hypothetical protein
VNGYLPGDAFTPIGQERLGAMHGAAGGGPAPGGGALSRSEPPGAGGAFPLGSP